MPSKEDNKRMAQASETSYVAARIPRTDHRQLKSKLAKHGLTVQDWFRTTVRDFLIEE